jgi:protoporphyrinogen oxidase
VKARVLVIGAGPAGLAAATRLLEGGRGRVSVRLLRMGHHNGGKAASYRGEKKLLLEHGWHMVLGFYHNMKGLMRRAGIDVEKTLRSMGGKQHVYEPWSRRLHTVSSGGGRFDVGLSFLSYDGLPLGDRLHFARFMLQAFARATGREDLRRHDDVCFRTWSTLHGLRPHVTRYSLFRFFREAYFNFPEEISAYHALQTLRLTSTSEDAEAFVVRGGYSEEIWDPIARYLEKLGGVIESYAMATDWVYEGRKIVGVRVARPDGAGHRDGLSSWTTARIPEAPGTERVLRDFDYVVSTIPHAVFVTMNAKDERMWSSPYFKRLGNLRSASTVSLTVLTRRPVMSYPGPVFGLPAPLGICTNMKPYWAEVRDRADIGAALSFVGQEAGFESWTDEQIIAFTLDNFSRVEEVGDIRRAGIVAMELHRNRSDFERLLLCEPGVQQFRPGPRTPFQNLFLAGDWVRNEIDLICMEGAVTSGLEAADLVLESMGGQ